MPNESKSKSGDRVRLSHRFGHHGPVLRRQRLEGNFVLGDLLEGFLRDDEFGIREILGGYKLIKYG